MIWDSWVMLPSCLQVRVEWELVVQNRTVCIYTDNSLNNFYLVKYRKERQTKVRMKEENNINKETNSCTWLPSCFVHDNQICDIVGSTGLNECRDLVVPSVHALSSREYQLHLLQQWHHCMSHAHSVWTHVLLVNSPGSDSEQWLLSSTC